MKKMILAGAVAAMLTACASVGGLVGGKEDARVTALASRSDVLVNDMAISLDEAAQSYVLALTAAGDTANANRIQTETKDLRKSKDKDQVSAAMALLNEVNLSAQMEAATEVTDEGKTQVKEAIKRLGAAIVLDGEIGTDAANLTSDAENVLSSLDAKELAVSSDGINKIIDNAKWVGTSAPEQATVFTTSADALKAFAEKNGVEIPTSEEIEAYGKELKNK